MLDKLSNARKAIAAGAGAILTALVFASDHLGWVMPAQAEIVVGGAIAILTPIVTWLVRPGKGLVTPQVPDSLV